MNKRFLTTALLLPFAAACDSPTDTAAPSTVAVKFSTSAPNASSALFASAPANGLVVAGSNGTLTITKIGLIVSELELERLESECDNSGSGNLCVDYEAPISFVELPLAGGAVTVAADEVPQGSYDELDFEVEDLDVDADDDSEKQTQIQNLFNKIRTTHGFSDFPEQASMVVEGQFTDAAGTRPFRVYFDAEIKVELRFDPALVIDGNGASRAIVVDVQPAIWFKRADGTAVDLSNADFADTGDLAEFEVEVSKGFAKVELDD